VIFLSPLFARLLCVFQRVTLAPLDNRTVGFFFSPTVSLIE